MVEKIELQKGFTPISSTGKVRNLKKQNGNLQQRKFGRELQEEENKKDSEGGHEFHDQHAEDEDLIEKRNLGPDSVEIQDNDIKKVKKDDGTIQGKIVDIIV